MKQANRKVSKSIKKSTSAKNTIHFLHTACEFDVLQVSSSKVRGEEHEYKQYRRLKIQKRQFNADKISTKQIE